MDNQKLREKYLEQVNLEKLQEDIIYLKKDTMVLNCSVCDRNIVCCKKIKRKKHCKCLNLLCVPGPNKVDVTSCTSSTKLSLEGSL